MSLPLDPLPALETQADDLLVALLATDDPATARTLLLRALCGACAEGLLLAGRYAGPTPTEFAALPRPVVAELVSRAQQITGAAVRVRAGKPPWGKG